jgi:putative addiction module killer protein
LCDGDPLHVGLGGALRHRPQDAFSATRLAVVLTQVDVGPGYRVYFSQRGTRLLLLLAGGDKPTQAKDMAKALELNRNFVESSA